jgi:hypothetical protein
MHLNDFPAVNAALLVARHLIWHTQARLFARISHPASLMQGESYDVDLFEPYFTGLYEGEFSSGGPAQLIATFNPQDGTWLWGFHNKSISQQGWHELRASLDTLEGLSALQAQSKFMVDEEQAMRLATWIARKAGYLGAYPAPFGETTAFLALKLSTDPQASPEPDDNRWCTLCGCRDDQVAVLLSGEHGYMCDECIDKHEALMPSELEPDVNYAADSSMPSCLLCDADTTPRIMHTYTSVCWECVGAAAGIMRQQRGQS